MAITKVTSSVLSSGSATDGYVLTADGSGNSAWEAAAGGGVDGIVSSADATAITINSSENVGIGTSNPASKLHVSNGSAGIQFAPDGISDGISFLQAYDWVANTYDGLRYYANEHYFYTGNNERMRITSGGNVVVGATSFNNDASGIGLGASNFFYATRSGGLVGSFNRLSSDGVIVDFRKNSSAIGSIDTQAGSLQITGANGRVYFASSPSPTTDNTYDLGGPSDRFDDVYATNGTIQTSDRNEKQDIAELSDAEARVAVAAKGLLRKFRWQSAVEEKGDEARIHFGIIAQDLQDAFTAEGLDAGDYAMFISTTWWETQTEVAAVEAVEEVTDEEGNVITEAVEAKDAYTRTDTYHTAEEAPEGATERTRLGVRYSELLAFIIAAI